MVPTELGANVMAAPLPQNSAEAAYIAFAMVDQLVSLLVTKRLVDGTEFDLIFESVTKRLAQGNDFDSQRAAKFVANRVTKKE
jgi:hypothetical protein